MANRSVGIDLYARVQGYVAGIRTAKAATGSLITELEKAERKRAALNGLGTAAGAMGAAAAAGVFVAVKSFADFDQAMSRARTATRATGTDLQALREAAVNAGADTKYSAVEAADGITELGKAGISTRDILKGGLTGALNLAASGQIEVGEAAEIAASTMTQFGLKGQDVTRIADVLAATAGEAQGGVLDVGNAMKYVGPVAAQMGLSLEEAAGAVGLLASNGIIGEQAGTSLRGMLTSLTSPSKMASDTMKQLGINMYDASGEFVGFDGIAGQLQTTMSGLTNAERDQALGRIFGNEQITAARVLYKSGAGAVQEWNDKVNDQGRAAQDAASLTDNLIGDIERLGGALSSLLTDTGSASNGPLRGITQGLTGVVDVANALPDPVKSSALAMGALVAATGGLAFVGTRAVTAVSATRENIALLRSTAVGTAASVRGLNAAMLMGGAAKGAALIGGMALATSEYGQKAQFGNTASMALMGTIAGPWGAAIGGGIGLAMDFADANNDLEGSLKRANKALTSGDLAERESALKSLREQVQASSDELKNDDSWSVFSGGAFGAVRDNFSNIRELLTGDVADARDRLGELQSEAKASNEALASLVGEARGLSEVDTSRLADDMEQLAAVTPDVEAALEGTGIKLETLTSTGLGSGLLSLLQRGEAVDAIRRYDEQTATAAGRQSVMQDALQGTSTELDSTAKAAKAAADAINAVFDPALGADDAMSAYLDGLEDLREKLGQTTKGIGQQDDATRANRDLLKDSIRDVQARATAELELSGNQDKANAIMRRGRRDILAAAKANGLNTDSVKELLDQLGLVRPPPKVKIDADPKPATKAIKDVDSQKIKNKKARVDAETARAKQAVRDFVGTTDKQLSGIGPYNVDINLSAQARQTIAAGNLMKGQVGNAGVFGANKRDGGSIVGPGGKREDKVPIWASNGEHMMTADDVDKLGGQAGAYRLRQAIQAGEFKLGDLGQPGLHHTLTPAFRDGGAISVTPKVDPVGLAAAVGAVTSQFDSMATDIETELSSVVNQLFKLLGAGVGGLSPIEIARGQAFARSQVGKPYVWGGVGPGGYDCSGFVSAVLNAALGMNPYSRRGATGSMPWGGFRAGGGGAFDVGWFTGNPGHTAARIGDMNVESYGGHGPAIGSGARGPGDSLFNRRMSYAGKRDTGGLFPSGSFVANESGRPEWVLDPQETQRFAKGGAITKKGTPLPKLITKDQRSALRGGLNDFDYTLGMEASDVSSELRDMRAAIREAFGPKSTLYIETERLGGRMLKSSQAMDRERARREQLTDRLNDLRSERASYGADVASKYRNDAFGGGASDLLLQLQADTNDARTASRGLSLLAKKGLDTAGSGGGLFKELAASGNTSLIGQLSTMSRAQIDVYEKAFTARTTASGRLGAQAGTAVYGQAVKSVEKQIRQSNKVITKLDAKLDRLEARIERGVERGASKGIKDAAKGATTKTRKR